MGGILNTIGSIATGGIKDIVLGVLDRIKLAPEKKAEIELAMAQHAFEIQKMELELQAKEQERIGKEIEAASANIRAEATSGDKFTSRMRPSFGYTCIFIIGWNYVAVPLFGRSPIEFPEALFWLFGSVILGYTGARTWEKITIPTKQNKGGN
jgi:hypothetical protein